MKKYFIILVYLIFSHTIIYAQSETVKDVKGWNNSKWGMTENEVVKAFNGNVKHLEENKISKDGDGYCSLRMEGIEIDKEKYFADFWFDNNKKLYEVLIQPNKEGGSKLSEINFLEYQFKDLERKIIEKYNKPISDEDKDDKKNEIIKHQRLWNFPSTTIELNYLCLLHKVLGEKSEFLCLRYKKKTAENNI